VCCLCASGCPGFGGPGAWGAARRFLRRRDALFPIAPDEEHMFRLYQEAYELCSFFFTAIFCVSNDIFRKYFTRKYLTFIR
jgi:hypothetical protein